MALGLSFGKSGTKSTSNTAVDKTETGVQTGVTDTTSTQTGSSTTNQNTSGVTTESGAAKNTGTTSATTAGTEATTRTGSTFSDVLLNALESKTLSTLDKVDAGGVDTSVLNFNKDKFVNDAYGAAVTRQQGDLETSMNSLFDAAGGTAGGNSNVALLAQRMGSDSAASLAGIRAQLEAQGSDILNKNITTQLTAKGQDQGFVNQLLNALKGGSTTETGTGTTNQVQTGTTQNVGETQNRGTSDTTSSTEQTSIQSLIQLVNQLVNTNQHTTGTENVNATTSKSGFGGGLSI